MFDTDKLWDEAMQKKFCQHIQESAEPVACGNWGSFRDRITTAAHDTIGVVALRKRREGLPSDVADLVSRRHQARLNGDKPLYRSLKKAFSRALGAPKKPESERSVIGSRHTYSQVTQESGPAFRAISTLAGKKRTSKSCSVFSEDGKVLEGAEALQRLAGYFEELLDIPRPSLGIDTSGMTPLTADPPISTCPSPNDF